MPGRITPHNSGVGGNGINRSAAQLDKIRKFGH